MKTIRIAVIGADRRGRIALLAHRPDEGFHLVAACGLNPDRLEFYREKCGADLKITANYQDIVKDPDIDAVFVCTPDYLHERHAIDLIRAGKFVYLEKPMAISIEGCDRILDEAERHGAKLYLGHNMRFFSVMRKMKELIDQGRIGQVEAIWCRHFVSYGGDAYFKNWHSQRKNNTGLLLQKGAHDIDIIHWLGGAYTKRVVGMGKLSVYNRVASRRESSVPEKQVVFDKRNWPPLKQQGLSPEIDVEDHSMIMMQLENGVQASYTQCHYTPDDHRNYTIIGTEGRIENYGDVSLKDHWASIHLWNRRTGYSEHGHEVFRMPDVEGSHGGSDPLTVEDFLRFLRGESTSGASPIDARMAVATGVLGTESLRDGSTPRDVPPVWRSPDCSAIQTEDVLVGCPGESGKLV